VSESVRAGGNDRADLPARELLAAFFKSKGRLEAECCAETTASSYCGASRRPHPAQGRRSLFLRPALSLVPGDPQGYMIVPLDTLVR